MTQVTMFQRFIVLNNIHKEIFGPLFSLFACLGTLLCCALPALFVSLGMGAVVASIISSFPWITILSKYKIYVFIGSGLTLIVSTFIFWQARNNPCPSDPKLALVCKKLRSVSLITIILSYKIYLVGLFFAFFANQFFNN